MQTQMRFILSIIINYNIYFAPQWWEVLWQHVQYAKICLQTVHSGATEKPFICRQCHSGHSGHHLQALQHWNIYRAESHYNVQLQTLQEQQAELRWEYVFWDFFKAWFDLSSIINISIKIILEDIITARAESSINTTTSTTSTITTTSITTTTYNPYHNCKYRRGYKLFKWNGFCTGPFQSDIYIIYLTFIFSLFSARAD